MFKVNELINNEELINRLGSEKQKSNYYKNNKLLINIKKSLLKKLSIYTSFVEIKINNRIFYKINQVYDDRKIITNNIKYSKSKLNFLIQQLIINYIKNNNNTSYYSNTMLLKNINVFNNDYFELINCREYLSNKLNVDKRSIKIFKSIVSKETIRLIRHSIGSLKEEEIIKAKIGIIVIDSNNKQRFISKKEEIIFNEVKEMIIENYNEKSLIDLCFKGMYKHYVKGVCSEMNKRNFDYNLFYQGYKISKVNLDNFKLYEKEVDFILKTFKKEFGNRIIDMAKNMKKNSLAKSEKNMIFGEAAFLKHQETEKFIDDVQKIVNYFID